MNPGCFKKGHDPRRHPLTIAEKQLGFQNALISIATRHPQMVDANGIHLSKYFLLNSGRHNGLSQQRRGKQKK